MRMCQDHCQLYRDLDLCPVGVRDLVEGVSYLNMRKKCSDPPPAGLDVCMPEVTRLSLDSEDRPTCKYIIRDLSLW